MGTRHPLAAPSMAKAADAYKKAKQPEQAADIYLELARTYRDSDEAAPAAFAAGRLQEEVAYFAEAADAYELVVQDFGASAQVADALYNAGVLRQALGQHDRAIAHYQAYTKRFKDRDDAAEVAFRIGVVYEDAGDDGRAEQAFRAYAAAHKGVPRRQIEAQVRAARTALRLGQIKRATESLDTALKLWRRIDPKDRAAARPWAAEARYHQGELLFEEYESVALDVKPKLLQKSLKRKSELLARAQAVYGSVIEYEDLKWATASLYRVGQIYDGFAEALRTAPTPGGLAEADAMAYRDALDSYVIDIEEKAIDLFATGYQKAIEMQVYDGYTKKIREALGRLASNRYPPERESRAAERVGDRPLPDELVEGIDR